MALEEMTVRLRAALCALLLSLAATPVRAGPPYVTDDPEPTPLHEYEIFLFGSGAGTRDGHGGAYGLDFNFGGGPDLQLSATLPVAYEHPAGGDFASGIGNIELAAKFRVHHSEPGGWDVAVFPRVFLPSGTRGAGDPRASLFLPVWLQHDWNPWSVFGGGGCTLTVDHDLKNFCLVSAALTRQIGALQLGAEAYHLTADAPDSPSTTAAGGGARYDVTDHLHVLGYLSTALTNADETNRLSWYSSLLLTF